MLIKPPAFPPDELCVFCPREPERGSSWSQAAEAELAIWPVLSATPSGASSVENLLLNSGDQGQSLSSGVKQRKARSGSATMSSGSMRDD